MADIFADCPWCKGRGCTFCPGEREKAGREEDERARRVWETRGFYKAPDFEYWSGEEFVYYSAPDWKPQTISRGILTIDEGVM